MTRNSAQVLAAISCALLTGTSLALAADVDLHSGMLAETMAQSALLQSHDHRDVAHRIRGKAPGAVSLRPSVQMKKTSTPESCSAKSRSAGSAFDSRRQPVINLKIEGKK